MNPKAFGSAPLSVCITLSICAVARTSEPFASSDGWNCMPNIGIHRWAPLVDAPMKYTTISNTNDKANNGVISPLK